MIQKDTAPEGASKGQFKKRKSLLITLVVIGVILVIFLKPLGHVTSFLYQLFFNKNIELKGHNGSFNMLLLGIGGGEHEGPDLTDTIIFANVQPDKNKIYLISIPRDLWTPDLEGKVNNAYAFGQEQGRKGIILAKSVIEKVTGQPIDYVLVIDFAGFVSLVDQLGGVDVRAEKSFDDYQYPIEGKENDLCGHTEEELPLLATNSSELEAFPCRYKHIHFDKGIQHMGGIQALEFVRSRHGTNDEGSDFARGRRQQAVISAIKSKVFSLGILLNPTRIFGIYNIIKNNINTNIAESEYDDFVKLAQKMEKAKINNYVLDEGNEAEEKFGLLINPPISAETKYQWVLTPRKGISDFSEVQEYIACIIKGNECIVGKEGIEIKPTLTPNKPKPSR